MQMEESSRIGSGEAGKEEEVDKAVGVTRPGGGVDTDGDKAEKGDEALTFCIRGVGARAGC